MATTEQFELLSDRLDDTAGGAEAVNNDFEETEDEFEARFDPLNDIELKVSLLAVDWRQSERYVVSAD